MGWTASDFFSLFQVRLFVAIVLISIGSTVVAGQKVAASAVPCGKENAAFDELLLRTMATQTSLELLRDYSSALDQALIATRESAYAEGVVDVAALAAGWPLGSAAEKFFLGEVKNTLTEKLIKAGFKSVDKALLKDPSLKGVFDNLTGGPMSGTVGDIGKEAAKNKLKDLLGEAAGSSVFVVYDSVKLGKSAYSGMKKLDALHAARRNTEDQILKFEVRLGEQADKLDDAKKARDLCLDRFAKNLPADNSNPFWRSVIGYLGNKWLPEEPMRRDRTVDERFIGNWTCPAKITIILNRDGSGAWDDHRGGAPGSLQATGKFPGNWSSSGDTAYLSISRVEYGNRGGEVKLTLVDGKLHDIWGDVYTRER